MSLSGMQPSISNCQADHENEQESAAKQGAEKNVFASLMMENRVL